MTNERTLIEKAANGDKVAFERLLQEKYDIMYRIAYKFCANRQDAEDVTQESCIKLARSIGTFRHDSAFSSWLYRLVINTAKDMIRAKKPAAALEDGHIGIAAATAETTTYANQILDRVYALPDNEKTALLLVASEGLSHREAAEIMGCKEGTISWYLHEARKKLEIMDKERSAGDE